MRLISTNHSLQKVKKALSLILLNLFVLFGSEAYADRCWFVGGCEGEIVYVYVPPTQYDDQNYNKHSCFAWLKVFEQSSLPEIGSIVKPHHNDIGWYFDLNGIKNKYDEVEKLFKYEKDKKEQECLRFAEILNGNSPSWGGGMKAKILSYDKAEKGLFAKVKILTSK